MTSLHPAFSIADDETPEPASSTLVGAIMPDRRAAVAAAEMLRGRGIASDDLVTATIRRGRRVIDSRADRRFRVGVLKGAIIGAVVLALAFGLTAALLSTQHTIWLGAAAAGILVGAVLGAYVGLNRERPQMWEEAGWVHVDLDGDEVLLVTRTSRPYEASTVLEVNGGRLVEPTLTA